MAKRPKWMEQADQRLAAWGTAMQQQAGSVSVPLRSRAPGYRFLGIEVSCIPDSVYPWNPTVVKMIQGVAPDIVPIWTKWVFDEPVEFENPQRVVYGRHGLARVINNLHSERHIYYCPMPSYNYGGVKLQKPAKIELIPQGSPDQKYKDLPGAYVPFDDWFYRIVKDNYGEKTPEQLKEFYVRAPKEAHARAAAIQDAEAERKNADIQKYVNKRLESVSEVEMKEYFLHRPLSGLPTKGA